MSFQRNSLLGRSVQADPFKAYSPTGLQKKEGPVTNIVYDTLDTQRRSRTAFKHVFPVKLPLSMTPYPFAAVGFVGSVIGVYYMLKK